MIQIIKNKIMKAKTKNKNSFSSDDDMDNEFLEKQRKKVKQ